MTNNKLGNITTYGKFILIMIAGRTLAMLAAHGINLPVSDVELAGYLGILLGFLYSICDSYFKNNIKWTYLKKLISVLSEDEEIEDIDPAAEYEDESYPAVGDDDGC